MASKNKRGKSHRYDFTAPKLAGGSGAVPAKQNAEALLRRSVLSCLLWENIAYASGASVARNIKDLIKDVDPNTCANIAKEARLEQKLRHVPLFIAREMARLDTHKSLVGDLLPEIINRPDEITEFLSMYWEDGKQPISKQVKIGLSNSFANFNEYQLAKWNKKKEIKLKDVMNLVHPKPPQGKEDLYNRLKNDELRTPDTWEVGLSAAKSDEEKRNVWISLIEDNKLGAMALLKNLRGMQSVNVPKKIIRQALLNANSKFLLPIDFIRAGDHAPDFVREIEDLMLKGLSSGPKLAGETLFILDVSGSMGNRISSKSDYTRMDVGMAMSILAMEMCDACEMWLTAGSDPSRTHVTKKIPPLRGFGLRSLIQREQKYLGGGGIFTYQCLEHIKKYTTNKPDRIIVFSDSQDCDIYNIKTPDPFGQKNYIIDVSSHKNGINYEGTWDAEISGYSEHFLKFISMLENNN